MRAVRLAPIATDCTARAPIYASAVIIEAGLQANGASRARGSAPPVAATWRRGPSATATAIMAAAELDAAWDIQETAAHLTRHGYRTVALQFDDTSLAQSVAVSARLQAVLGPSVRVSESRERPGS